MSFKFGVQSIPSVSRKSEDIIKSIRKNMYYLYDALFYYSNCFLNGNDMEVNPECDSSQLPLAKKSIPIYLNTIKKELKEFINVDKMFPKKNMSFINSELSELTGQISTIYSLLIVFHISQIEGISPDDITSIFSNFWHELMKCNMRREHPSSPMYISLNDAFSQWEHSSNIY